MTIESYGEYLNEESALKLRHEADNIIAHDPEEKKTYWYGFHRPPQNIIEEFIYQSSCQHNMFHSYIGAEWWIRTHNKLSSTWDFHVDSDLGHQRRSGKYRAAPFCTITYLSDYGQPTVVLDRTADWTKDQFFITGDNNWSFWASPKMGKHINWSLPYFHGVPANFGYLPEGETRVTLMFNCWKTKPWEPECIEYNLPYNISDGRVTLIPKKDGKLPMLDPHGYFNTELEGGADPISIQYHGYNQQKKSWMVTQIAPNDIDTTPRFPTQEHQMN